MKILFVLENYFPHIGGVEVLFKNLAEGLAKAGHDVSIVTHKIKGTKKEETINNVKVYRINCLNSRYLFTFLSIPKVIKLAKKADIIHATIFNAAFPAWLASKLLGKPCVLNVNEVWIGQWKKLGEMNWLSAQMHELLERMIYVLKYSHYICISKYTQKQLLSTGINKNKTTVIYPGVDYELFNPNKYDKSIRKKINAKFIYLFFGRPGISKGLEYLMRAVPLISEKIKGAKLLAIVSTDKAYKKRYNYMLKLIKKLKIEDKIIIIKPVSHKDLPRYIKASDCVAVPSLAEGFGYTAAEACAMNVPVVASNVASLPEVISGKYILVEPKNSKAIAFAVENVYKGKIKSHPKRRFSKDKMIENYINFYKKIAR